MTPTETIEKYKTILLFIHNKNVEKEELENALNTNPKVILELILALIMALFIVVISSILTVQILMVNFDSAMALFVYGFLNVVFFAIYTIKSSTLSNAEEFVFETKMYFGNEKKQTKRFFVLGLCLLTMSQAMMIIFVLRLVLLIDALKESNSTKKEQSKLYFRLETLKSAIRKGHDEKRMLSERMLSNKEKYLPALQKEIQKIRETDSIIKGFQEVELLSLEKSMTETEEERIYNLKKHQFNTIKNEEV